ncbi:hypothetical protein PHAVU_001G101700 [Phaseolus vulgaris]|uniref:Uncharacterized protein n=1 Tax=Phaseolus vulgaris TaxID=3885 RepID=V7CY50_PHAVU|nr:hypothetical protein PHAVU_001G101700g [Phaseolus vulgaris]ESW33826.1 hypothetical protein PHAVU_001G101700g [Phaseolus vulgaris]
MEESEVLQELEKLSHIESEESVNEILCTLWSTRNTGLPLSDKSRFQSLLRLSSLSQLDPVLACLRSLLGKCARYNLHHHDLLKLFPPDLPLPLRTNLLSSLRKNTLRWKEDASLQSKGTPTVAPSLLWPRHHPASVAPLNRAHSETASPCFQCDAVAPSDDLESLPCLKSMTWTMENRGSSPADRVAIISLKLHDYSKSPSGETEVKFHLTRDTLEAMLRSMTYIREQLNTVETSSGPTNKKQKL